MPDGKVTYGELIDAWSGLGYRDRVGELRGKPTLFLENARLGDPARILLPVVDRDDEVLPRHADLARSILDRYGLITPDPARELMERIAAAQAVTSDK